MLPTFGGFEPREPISALDFDRLVPSRLYLGWGGLSLVQQSASFPFLDRSPGLLDRPGRVLVHGADAGGRRIYVARSYDVAVRVLGAPLGWEVRRFSGRTGKLAFHPRNVAMAVVAGGSGYFVTSDGGEAWTWRGTAAPLGELHDIRFDRFVTNGLLAAGTQGGFASRDNGVSWRRVAPQQLVRSLVQVDRRTLLALGCGLLRSTNEGRRWRTVIPCETSVPSPVVSLFREVRDVIVDPRSPSRLYAPVSDRSSHSHLGDSDRVLRSFDGGATWRHWLFSTVFVLSPSHSKILYALSATADDTILRSSNQGRSFQPFLISLAPAAKVVSLAVSPADPDLLLAAVAPSGTAVSFDGGAHWQLRDEGLESTSSPFREVTADPHRPGRFFLDTLGGLYVLEVEE